MQMNVNYEYYKIFYYVAKYRSFTKAANALYANQPNVTRIVKNLESELGCPLFVRSNHSVTLTPEGEKLFAHIKVAVEHIQIGEEELSSDQNLQSGTVSIGATENTLHYVLLPLLKDFRTRYPDINIKVTNHNTTQAVNALENGFVDFAVVTSPVHLSKSLTAAEILNFQEYAVGSSAFSRLAERQVTVKEISEYPLISLGKDSMSYELYSRFFMENGAVLTPNIEVATTDQILSMVKNDLGIGFVPEYFIADPRSLKDLYVINLIPPAPTRTICLIKKTDRPLSIAAGTLERMILKLSCLTGGLSAATADKNHMP